MRFRYVTVSGRWCRLVRQGRDPEDARRTAAAGGRYNPPGAFSALYLGDQPATCLLEVLVHAGRLRAVYDLAVFECRLERVVDLVSDAGRSGAGANLDDLVAPPRPVRGAGGAPLGARYGITWEIGRRAVRLGARGLLVPSAAIPSQQVLVVLPAGLTGAGMSLVSSGPLRTDPRLSGESGLA